MRLNLKNKIALINFLTVSIVLAFCFIIFGITIHIQNKNEAERRLRENYGNINNKIVFYIQNLDYIAYTVMYSNWVQQLMVTDKNASPIEFVQFQRNASHFLSNLAWANENISFVLISQSAMIWSNNALYYDAHYDIQKQPWFDELIGNKKYIEYGKSELFRNLNDTWSVSFYYPVVSYYNFMLLGYLVINVTPDNFSAGISEEINTIGWIEVRDKNGNTIYSDIPDGENSSYGKALSFSGPLLDGNLSIDFYARIPRNPFEKLDRWYFFFLLLIPIIAIFIFINLKFSQYLTMPIVECKNAMFAIHNNNFNVRLMNHYYDEIGELIDGYNEMSDSLLELLRKNREMEKLKRDAELNILQQRVNPHFLYNTLEIINGFIFDGHNNEAVRVCELLGKMYHYNLMNRKWVAVREEYEYVKQYLEICCQSNNKLSVVWDISEDSMGMEILKMILQPLVENAVLHGLRDRPADCRLVISAKNTDTKLTISIMDNGKGINPDQLAQIEGILENIRKGIPLESVHIGGIPNVYQRLYLEYGETMSFFIESNQVYGTKIFLSIPKTIPD
ncbi:MAG: histidine kinase [Treponema sp.]|nr:histidine kinase [Treponema sp.]